MNTDKTSPTYIKLNDREQQLDMLLHVQQFSSLIVLLSGNHDIGKSVLLTQVQEQLSADQQVIHFDALHNTDEQSVIACMALQLSCSPSIDAIEQVNGDTQKFVLVDDAHLLEQTALLQLVMLCTNQKSWHLVLCGDDILAEKLNAIQLQLQLENLYHHIDLLPLSEVDSSQFITQLYQQASYENVPLSDQKIHQLWQLSGGIPGKLIELIDVEKEHQHKLKSRFPLGHVAAIGLIGMALVFSFLYQDEGQGVGSQDVIAQLLQEKGVTEPLNFNTENGAEAVTQLLQERSGPSKATDKTKKLVAVPISPSAVNKPAAAKAAQQLTMDEIAVPAPPTKRVIASANTAPSLNKPKKVTKPRSSPKSHPLLSAEPNEYLLQLLGVRSEKSAKSFMARFARQLDAEKLSVYQTQYKGQPWFVVVYGPFNNKSSANSEASSLGRTLKSRPWIRPVSKIQEDIRKFIIP